ncbi:hypothetical protein HNY73_009011 [Argiope bruennichi]|uniref:Uncharacterized protein n=1 Tax=Argiope bruennichi TaxID=94029 RepID=A0A8T0FDN1_ARGBR|nr:hypothetical protein HNY73_009011 [Argiope bruennichi]
MSSELTALTSLAFLFGTIKFLCDNLFGGMDALPPVIYNQLMILFGALGMGYLVACCIRAYERFLGDDDERD